MSEEPKSKEKEAPATEIIGQLTFWRCKDCGSWTPDPQNHSVTSEHWSGYLTRSVPVEQEVTKEQVAEAEKKTNAAAEAAAGKLIRQAKK